MGGLVVALVVLAALLATLAIRAAQDQTQTLADMEVGECYLGNPNDLDIVDCGDAHHGELFARLDAEDPDGDFPAEELGNPMSLRCEAELSGYFGAGKEVAVASNLDLRVFPPSERDWEEDKRLTECVVVRADGGQFTGSVKDRGAEAEEDS